MTIKTTRASDHFAVWLTINGRRELFATFPTQAEASEAAASLREVAHV